MNQKEVLEFDGFRVERESFLGGDCYGVVTSCKKDEKGVSYHLEVEFDISTAKFHFSKCYAHEVVPCQELSAGGKLKVMAYLIEKAACAYVTEKAAVQKMSFEKLNAKNFTINQPMDECIGLRWFCLYYPGILPDNRHNIAEYYIK